MTAAKSGKPAIAAEPGPDGAFRKFVDAGELRLQRFDSGGFLFPPRPFHPATSSTRYTWEKAKGTGTVYATSVVRNKPEAGGDFNIALVDLDEGVRMMSRVVGMAPGEVKIGMKVKAKIGEIDGKKVVLFEAA